MGQFTSTTYSATTESIIQGYQNRLSIANPYYRFTNKKPTPVTYWNINTAHTTLDHGTEQSYDQLTDEDSFRFNRINGFYLYGIGRIETNTVIEEFGPRASSLEGEALVLPNTIIPLEGDYFTIDYLMNGDKKILFRVVDTNLDTLENGANFYKISYKMDQTHPEFYKNLLNQTVKTYKYIPSSAGTNFVALLDEETENGINQLNKIIEILRQYYIDLFYRKNVQTFVYPYATMLLYDPYLIEFLIRNKVLLTDDPSYIYISQATFKSSTFSIEYTKSLFLNIENRDSNLSLNTVYPIQICDPGSLLVDRMEEYLELSIQRQNFNFNSPINILDMDLFDRIVENNIYNEDDSNAPLYRNIIINFMNGKDASSINKRQLTSLENISYARTKDLFYELVLILHILNTYITELMTNPSSDNAISCAKECYANGLKY